MTRDDEKAVLKEALKEWMDEQFALFGKWSLGAISALALSALVYFVLFTSGLGPR
jgi:hypothetical protein